MESPWTGRPPSHYQLKGATTWAVLNLMPEPVSPRYLLVSMWMKSWHIDISWSNQSKVQDSGLMVEHGNVLSGFELE